MRTLRKGKRRPEGHDVTQGIGQIGRITSSSPEIETIAPRPEAGRFDYIHCSIEVLADSKRLMSVAAEGHLVTTLLPPPAHQFR